MKAYVLGRSASGSLGFFVVELTKAPKARRHQVLRLFDGETFSPALDSLRLTRQADRVWSVVSDGQWVTLSEIRAKTELMGGSDSEAAISARLRDLRKEKFGGHTVERRRRGEPSDGLFEYRLADSAGVLGLPRKQVGS